jgi:hypothetical protein
MHIKTYTLCDDANIKKLVKSIQYVVSNYGMLTTIHSFFEINKGNMEEYELHENFTLSSSFSLVWDAIAFIMFNLKVSKSDD